MPDQESRIELLAESGGLGDCPGFALSGVACDVRGDGGDRLDLALVHSQAPSACAGVFTLNDVCAAPVRVSRDVLAASRGTVGGCVINSGNANACTGETGIEDARRMAREAREATAAAAPYLVCSTGRIGRALPMDRISAGIGSAAEALAIGPGPSLAAADAILTSDTRRKVATARFSYEGKTFTVAGMAKGAGMIQPAMATMLAFVATDLKVEPMLLKEMLLYAVDDSFNAITIDGDMSTNDTVLLFANGVSGVAAISTNRLFALFKEAVCRVCRELAEKIVGDGEKITRVVELRVKGTRSVGDAEKVARAVANSLLVKTSWYGSDPNWGRIADAAGYARVGLDEDRLDLFYGDCPALLGGKVQQQNADEWQRIVADRRFSITIDLNQGDGRYRLLTTDLSEAYVDFNKSE